MKRESVLIFLVMLLVVPSAVYAAGTYTYRIDTVHMRADDTNDYEKRKDLDDTYCQKVDFSDVSKSTIGDRNKYVSQLFVNDINSLILTPEENEYEDSKIHQGGGDSTVRIEADFNGFELRGMEYEYIVRWGIHWGNIYIDNVYCVTNGDVDGDTVCDPGITEAISTANGLGCAAYNDLDPKNPGPVFSQGASLGEPISIEFTLGGSYGTCVEGDSFDDKDFCGDQVTAEGDGDVGEIYSCNGASGSYHSLLCGLEVGADEYMWEYTSAENMDEGDIWYSKYWDEEGQLGGQKAFFVKEISGKNYWKTCADTPPDEIICITQGDVESAHYCCSSSDTSCNGQYETPSSRGALYIGEPDEFEDGELSFNPPLYLEAGETLRFKIKVQNIDGGQMDPIKVIRKEYSYSYLIQNNMLEDIKYLDKEVEYRITEPGRYDAIKFEPFDAVESISHIEIFTSTTEICSNNEWVSSTTNIGKNSCTGDGTKYLESAGDSSGDYCCGAERENILFQGKDESEYYICHNNANFASENVLTIRARSKIMLADAQTNQE